MGLLLVRIGSLGSECGSFFSPFPLGVIFSVFRVVLCATCFPSVQQLLEDGELETVYWLPGVKNPADGLTKLRSEMGPIMTLLETGRFQPGILRPLKGLASSE